MNPLVARVLCEKAPSLDLSSPKGIIQDYRGWWAQCPRCKTVNGPYRSTKEAALKRICGACHFEEVMKLKRELEKMGRGQEKRTTKAPWPLCVGEARRQNRFNPAGIHRVRGQLVNKYGKPMEVDWEQFEKRRKDRMNPLYVATKPKVNEAEELPLPEPPDPKAQVQQLLPVREITVKGNGFFNAYGMLKLAVREFNLGGRNVKGRKWARTVVDVWPTLPPEFKQAVLADKAELYPSGEFDCRIVIPPKRL